MIVTANSSIVAAPRVARVAEPFENIASPACLVGDDGVVRGWNDRLAELTGIESRDAVGRRLDDAWPEFASPCVRGRVSVMLLGGERVDEFDVVREGAGGDRAAWRVRVTPTMGSPRGVVIEARVCSAAESVSSGSSCGCCSPWDVVSCVVARARWSVLRRGVQLERERFGQIPARISCDVAALRRITEMSLSSCIGSTSEGGVRVCVQYCPSAEGPTGQVVLEVSDTRFLSGITADAGGFNREASELRAAVEAAGGTLEATREPSTGVTYTTRLPARFRDES